jgi:glutathione peroxidase
MSFTATRPRCNFYKYLIARDGRVVDAYSSMTGPEDRSFVREIEKQLAMR